MLADAMALATDVHGRLACGALPTTGKDGRCTVERTLLAGFVREHRFQLMLLTCAHRNPHRAHGAGGEKQERLSGAGSGEVAEGRALED